MASVRTIARKLEAWQAGYPLPKYDTIHHAIMPPNQTMIVAFVRMAGESRPWGIAWGPAGSAPRIESVPDGRIRDDVAVLCATFAEDLLEHLRVHNWTFDPAPQKPELSELRQVWLPNGQHVAMLHQLSYTYSQTRFGGENQDILRALGRVAGWMFRDTSRTGNQHTVSASQLLSDSYVFPAQDTRTTHLGFQLAWLTTDGDRNTRLAATAEAEHLTVSPTMDPSLERDDLSGLVSKWQEGRRAGEDVSAHADAIAAILHEELRRRLALTEQAYQLMMNNDRPINAGVGELVTQAHSEFWFQHQRIELRLSDPSQGPAFVAHPETDFHGSAAASRYLICAAADEAYIGYLIHDDPALFREALDDGRAFESRVVRVYDVGVGRSTAPRWVIRLDPTLPHRLRENARITPHGSRGHEATIVEIDACETDLFVTVEWTGRKTRPLLGPIIAKPADDAWVGVDVAFVQSDAASLTQRRSQRVWSAAKGPGAWLTHGKAQEPIEISGDDGVTDLIVDDVAQIEKGVDV
ncbi:hypothetical protein [Mycolicibacter heraklionensis]|uniref:hypothetical protein n=1 Tax=Mycolicibacter heraklionensis TaxID=512402 RepID=UPI0007E98D4E|nr:hypothetical protein [Mycolicibacter heraklionensis]OBG34923.1 hypothetical protein A5671_03730 [Mycolicibacter heraklionensis]